MVQKTSTPLELTAGVGFYNNTVIVANTQVANNVATYQSSSLMANLVATLNAVSSNISLGISPTTITALTTIGANVNSSYCPALGDSISSNAANTSIGNVGFVANITNSANTYIGNGNLNKFIQAYNTVQGYISVTNGIIESVVNANTDDFVGPAFNGSTAMDDLITGDLTKITLALPALGEDLANLGEAFSTDNLDLMNTPAGLLQQIAAVGNILNGSTPAVQNALLSEGLTLQDIADLVDDNRLSLFNPTGLTDNEFNTLQRRAYPALAKITGTDLQDVLDILGVASNKLNVDNLSQMLDPVKIFPLSYPSLTLPTPSGPVLIYNTDGTVNDAIAPILNSGALSPVGCDEMSKIMPADQAAANRAIQLSLQQVKGIGNATLQQLSEILV